MTSFHKVNSHVVNCYVVNCHVVNCHVVNSHVDNLSQDQLYISNSVKSCPISTTFCPIRGCSDDCLHWPGSMETRASITEFMAENISIHDPNAQEVKPTSVRFNSLGPIADISVMRLSAS